MLKFNSFKKLVHINHIDEKGTGEPGQRSVKLRFKHHTNFGVCPRERFLAPPPAPLSILYMTELVLFRVRVRLRYFPGRALGRMG